MVHISGRKVAARCRIAAHAGFVDRDGTITDAFLKFINAHNLLSQLPSSGIIKDSCFQDDKIPREQGNSTACAAQDGLVIAQRAQYKRTY